MGACGKVDRVLDSRSKTLGLDTSVEVLDKLLISYYLCHPTSSDGYLVELES